MVPLHTSMISVFPAFNSIVQYSFVMFENRKFSNFLFIHRSQQTFLMYNYVVPGRYTLASSLYTMNSWLLAFVSNKVTLSMHSLNCLQGSIKKLHKSLWVMYVCTIGRHIITGKLVIWSVCLSTTSKTMVFSDWP